MAWRCSSSRRPAPRSPSIPGAASSRAATERLPEMSGELVLSNARIVLADEVIDGSLSIRDGMIADIAAGPSRAGEDMGGDYLIPGLVELHTDHLEGHYAPRPKVRWNPLAAVLAHDAQVATAGITTVFDALRVGLDEDSDLTTPDMRKLADAI